MTIQNRLAVVNHAMEVTVRLEYVLIQNVHLVNLFISCVPFLLFMLIIHDLVKPRYVEGPRVYNELVKIL